MLILVTLLVFGNHPVSAPDYFKLPENYTEWQYTLDRSYSKWYFNLYVRQMWPDSLKDTSLSTNFEINEFELLPLGSYGWYSTCGHAYYKLKDVDTTVHGRMLIQWMPHIESKYPHLMACYSLVCKLWNEHLSTLTAWDTAGVCILNVNGLTAYRLRGCNIELMCDHSNEWVRQKTLYYIPTNKRDYFITCFALVFERHSGQELCFEEYAECERARQDSCDTIELSDDILHEQWDSIQAVSRYSRYYPHCIGELERAVEQTFKLKPETKRETAPPSD